MSKDQIPILIGISAIIVTLATGTCSTNTRAIRNDTAEN